MNTAKWALLTQQTAIEVTGQNIANVNNPDYNKQEVRLESSYPVNFGKMALGTGVLINLASQPGPGSILAIGPRQPWRLS